MQPNFESWGGETPRELASQRYLTPTLPEKNDNKFSANVKSKNNITFMIQF